MQASAEQRRHLAKTMLVANGEVRTARLNETEEIGAAPAELLTAARLLEQWILDVRTYVQSIPPRIRELSP